MAGEKKAAKSGGIGNKLKNMTDTNLLLLITVVIFFAMYIAAIIFQGKGFLKSTDFPEYPERECCTDYFILCSEYCYDYRRY